VGAHGVESVTNTNAAGAITGTSGFGYDDSGNMTGRTLAGQVAQTLGWDAEGELAQVAQDGNADGDTVDANEKDTYVYGADGDRLIRTQDGAATLYLPGGMELTAYADGRANTALRYYTFNGKTIATRSAAGATNQVTIVPDHHGTPALQVAQATNKVTRQYTDPFGATRGALTGDADANGRLDGTTPVWKGDHGYLDKPEDTTGLTAIGARMYDPALGRFITVDPVMDLTDPQQWNPYSYSNNNPTTWTDPSGLIPIGAGYGGYNPHNKNDKRRSDPCPGARSCVQQIRETPNSRATPMRTNRIDNHYVRARSVRPNFGKNPTFSKADTFRPASPALRNPDPVLNPPRVEGSFWGGPGDWVHSSFLTADGLEQWTDTGAKVTARISFAATLVQGGGMVVGLFHPPAGALIAGAAASTAVYTGLVSTGLSLVNGLANQRLGNQEDATSSYISFGVGVATAGYGTGASHLVQEWGKSMPYIDDFIAGAGNWSVGEVLDK